MVDLLSTEIAIRVPPAEVTADVVPAPGKAGDVTLTDVSREEAASIAHVLAWGQINDELKRGHTDKVDAGSFAKVIGRGTFDPDPDREHPRIQATRHEWTVFGGMDFGSGYRGFLQRCLEL